MQKRHSFYRQTGRYLWLSTTVNIPACTFMPLTHFSYAEFRFTLKPNRYKDSVCIFVLYRSSSFFLQTLLQLANAELRFIISCAENEVRR